MNRAHALLAALGFFLLAGCANTSIRQFDVDGANEALSEWSCKDMPSTCRAAYASSPDPAKDRDLRPARLLRAHVVLVMFARYAAARYPDVSDDVVNDATRVLGRLEAARANLKELTEANQSDDVYKAGLYAVERVDGLISLVDVAVAATRPTRRQLIRLTLLSSAADRINGGAEMLKDALRDVLYLDGYRDALEAMRRDVGTDMGRFVKARAILDEELRKYCGQLSGLAKLERKTCIPA